jgi:hypothetical protein
MGLVKQLVKRNLTDNPKRGSPGKGVYVGLIADGKGNWITVSQYQQEEMELRERFKKWQREQGR